MNALCFNVNTDCGMPAPITNGDITVTRTTYGGEATTQCDYGYYANVTRATCTGAGEWTYMDTCSERE